MAMSASTTESGTPPLTEKVMLPSAASPGAASPLTATPPAAGLASPRAASPMAVSPASTPPTRYSISSRAAFEARFGSPIFQEVLPAGDYPITPRARSAKRAGVTCFTDPLNPFNRMYSRNIAASTVLQEAKADASRAGSRTRNPGIQRADVWSERLSPKEARDRCVPHRYGNQDWRPGKASPSCAVSGQRSPRGLNSEGVGELLGTTVGAWGWTAAAHKEQKQSRSDGNAALGNYLNDMKRSVRTRRVIGGDPSEALTRMNNTRLYLPAEMTLERRSKSCDLGCVRKRMSANAESDHGESANYGFSRKKMVEGRGSSREPAPRFLAHEEPPPRFQMVTPRTAQQYKATRRFEEVVAYMQASTPRRNEEASTIKAKFGNTHGLLYSQSVVLHPVE